MNVPSIVVLLGTCSLALISPAVAADEPWSMAQERYACYTSGMTLQELASGGVTVLSHTPATKQYCEEARKWGIKACPYVSLYKVMDSSYLPDPASEAENAFFAYAVARLAGFDQWTGMCALRRDTLRRLYRVETGPASSELVEVGDVAYRQFQNALIVCNHSTQTVEVRVPVPPALRTALIELFDVREIPITEGHVVLSLPAESGRVIVSRANALDNLLREVEGQAVASRLHLEERDAGGNDSNATVLRKGPQDIERQAASLRKNLREATFPTAADRASLATLNEAAAAVQPLPHSDAFLTERLDNMHRHADLAAQLVTKP